MWLAFIRHFELAQDELNKLPNRHRDYYFREVLGMGPRPALPTRVWVAFSHVPGKTGSVPAGARLAPVTDRFGRALVYRTLREVAVGQLRLDRLATLWIPKPGKCPQGIGYSPRADSADGHGAAFAGEPNWPPFGSARAEKTEPADYGFAVSSPVLALQDGLRRVTVRAVLTKTIGATEGEVRCPLSPYWQVEFTGPGGWIGVRPAADRAPGGSLFAGEVIFARGPHGRLAPRELRLTVELARSEPAWVDYNPDSGVHGFGLSASAPTLRVRCLRPWAAIEQKSGKLQLAWSRKLQRVPVCALELDVEVEEPVDFQIEGVDGRLPAGVAIPLFGLPVASGAGVTIEKPELARKRLKSVTLQIDWQGLPTDRREFPQGLPDYFASYIAEETGAKETLYRNDQYRVILTADRPGSWQAEGAATAGREEEADTDCLFAWEGKHATPPRPSGALSPASRWTWVPSADSAGNGAERVGGRKFGLTLVAPPYGTGDSFQTVAKAVALKNARREAAGKAVGSAELDPEAVRILGELAMLAVPLPPSWSRRLAGKLGFKRRPRFVFHPDLRGRLTQSEPVPESVAAPGRLAYAARESGGGAEAEIAKIVGRLARLDHEGFSDVQQLKRQVAEQLCLVGSLETEPNHGFVEAVLIWLKGLMAPSFGASSPLPAPRPPLTLAGVLRIARYTAHDHVAGRSARAGGSAEWWHLTPQTTYAASPGGPLLPPLRAGGHLFIGLRGESAPERLSVLFVAGGAAARRPERALRLPQWSCLCDGHWRRSRRFTRTRVEDGTGGLQTSGLIHVRLPKGAGRNNTVMSEGWIWLRLSVADPELRPGAGRFFLGGVEAECLAPQAGQAPWPVSLEPHSLVALEQTLPWVQKVEQPLAGFGGAAPETEDAWARRVSQRLRHKGRAVAPQDYEQLLPARFPEVRLARVEPAHRVAEAGVVTVWVVPRTVAGSPPRPTPFRSDELRAMETALARIAPLSARIRVVNPVYAAVAVGATVVLQRERAAAAVARGMEAEINAWLAPWLAANDASTEPRRHLAGADLARHLRAWLSGQPACGDDELAGLGPTEARLVGGVTLRLEGDASAAGSGGMSGDVDVRGRPAVLVPAQRHAIRVETGGAGL